MQIFPSITPLNFIRNWYERLFADHPDRGYAFLENEMENKELSYGYSVLAWILERTSHKVVITTNFDNLVADALSIHSSTFPRVVGHDSLVGFVKAALRRPLIAKVHGDQGFAPRNTPDEIDGLSDEWTRALERVLEKFTPIVIGYAGNDGSLMAALESLPDGVPESLYWCLRERDAVTARVAALIKKRKGNIVLIPGFDEVMLRIQDTMREDWGMPDLLIEMKSRQRQREAAYQKQRDEIGARLTARKAADQRRVLADAALRTLAPKDGSKAWWEWDFEASAEKDADKREEIYLRGLRAIPQSYELMGNYALFLTDQRKDYDRAEEFYQKALEIEPENANNLGTPYFYPTNGRITIEPRSSTRRHWRLSRKTQTFETTPPSLRTSGRPRSSRGVLPEGIGDRAGTRRQPRKLAVFLSDQRKDYDRAEEFYQNALEIEPEDVAANNLETTRTS